MFAHEIKNHLATIGLNVEMMEEDLARESGFPVDTNRKRIERIKKGVHLIRETLQDLRALSDPLEVEPEELDLVKFLHDIGEFIEPECYAKKITLEYDLSDDLPEIVSDRKSLSTVILNLVINSMEAIERRGTIRLTAENDDAGVAISVTDTGGGVSREDEDKLFNDFFSTKEHGSGLGLVIVKRIITELGGSINFVNNPGKGMVFTISLPLSLQKKE
jgi:signal transduction histidine kinase